MALSQPGRPGCASRTPPVIEVVKRRFGLLCGVLAVLLSCQVFLSPAEAAEKKAHRVMDRRGGKVWDLDNREDVQALLDRLRAGEDLEILELEPESTYLEQMADLGIWTVVVFGIILLVLRRYAWKPILHGLQQRELAIQTALDEAHKARDEAARQRAQFDEQLNKANEQARQILDEARRAGERTTAEMIAEAHKKIQAEHERLQREMNLAYAQARRDLQTQAAQLATLVAGKVIRRHMNADDHRQLVEEALAELRQTGDGRQQTALV
jgi:F-type H+-transporting ATPase subunit b